LNDKIAAYRFITETVGADFLVKDLERADFKRIYNLVDKFPVNARKTKGSKLLNVKKLVELAELNHAPIISVTKSGLMTTKSRLLIDEEVQPWTHYYQIKWKGLIGEWPDQFEYVANESVQT